MLLLTENLDFTGVNKNQLKRFGKNLTTHRTDAGLTQEELAEKLGVSTRTYQRYESGENVSLATIYALADALKIKAGELL